MLNLMLQIVIEVQRDNKPGETNVKMGQKNLLKSNLQNIHQDNVAKTKNWVSDI